MKGPCGTELIQLGLDDIELLFHLMISSILAAEILQFCTKTLLHVWRTCTFFGHDSSNSSLLVIYLLKYMSRKWYSIELFHSKYLSCCIIPILSPLVLSYYYNLMLSFFFFNVIHKLFSLWQHSVHYTLCNEIEFNFNKIIVLAEVKETRLPFFSLV